jgi:hypothetical protein
VSARSRSAEARLQDFVRDHPRLRAAFLAGIAIALAGAAFQSVRLGIAGFHAQSAHKEVENWRSRSTPIRAQEWQAVHASVRAGLEYVPTHPASLEVLGTLDLARMRGSAEPKAAVGAARDALHHFRQSLIERPTSPFVWANVALAKMYLDEQDAEMFAALRHANALGPWEPVVQQTTVFVGLAAWSRMGPDERAALVETIKRASERAPAHMFQVVKGFGRYDLVCDIARYAQVDQKACANARKKVSG